MELLPAVLAVICSLLAFTVLGYIGFHIWPKVRIPELEPTGDAIQLLNLTKDLPEPVYRFFELNFGEQVPVPVSAVGWGRGKIIVRTIPRLGPLWSPFRWAVYLTPGRSFVYRTTVTWMGRKLLQGGDELRRGRGRFVMSKQKLESTNIDASEWVACWMYTFLAAPGFILADPNVIWEPMDEHTTRLNVPYRAGERWDFTLNFDSETGQLIRIDTVRTASRDGKKIPYHVFLDQYKNQGQGQFAGLMRWNWDDDFYQFHEISGIRYNVDISEAMEHGASETMALPPATATAEIEEA